jgi:hypothetical protein
MFFATSTIDESLNSLFQSSDCRVKDPAALAVTRLVFSLSHHADPER